MCDVILVVLGAVGFLVFCDIGLRMGEQGGAFGELRRLREEHEHNPWEFNRRYTRQYREYWGFRDDE